MKWKSETPSIGDTRERELFAWFPRKTGDGYTVWLECYGATEEFRETKNLPAWCPVKTWALFPFVW